MNQVINDTNFDALKSRAAEIAENADSIFLYDPNAALADTAAEDFQIPRSVRVTLHHAMIAGHLAESAKDFPALAFQADLHAKAAAHAFHDIYNDADPVAPMFALVVGAAVRTAEEEAAWALKALRG